MGGSVSSGRSNDELVDNLVDGSLIKTPQIERVFRAVDRAAFYLPKYRSGAYRDLAWREGRIHISAPSIYSRVMEALELGPGMSFLNIGSGTGYFSCMAGLLVGANGLNHNIEIHKELVEYARHRTRAFVRDAARFDDFDFCVPQFVHGNCLRMQINADETLLYDRIYVGVGVNDEQEAHVKSLLRVGGILVMPLNDNLVKLKRLDVNTWDTSSIMSVSFAAMIVEHDESLHMVIMPKAAPLTLQEICRFRLRQLIRKEMPKESSDCCRVQRATSTFNSRRTSCETLRRTGVSGQASNDADVMDIGASGQSSCCDVSDSSEPSAYNYPLARLERLFTPRRNVSNQHDAFFLENQLRMMLYGRMFDSTIARSRTNAFSSTLADVRTEDDQERLLSEQPDDNDDNDENEEQELREERETLVTPVSSGSGKPVTALAAQSVPVVTFKQSALANDENESSECDAVATTNVTTTSENAEGPAVESGDSESRAEDADREKSTHSKASLDEHCTTFGETAIPIFANANLIERRNPQDTTLPSQEDARYSCTACESSFNPKCGCSNSELNRDTQTPHVPSVDASAQLSTVVVKRKRFVSDSCQSSDSARIRRQTSTTEHKANNKHDSVDDNNNNNNPDCPHALLEPEAMIASDEMAYDSCRRNESEEEAVAIGLSHIQSNDSDDKKCLVETTSNTDTQPVNLMRERIRALNLSKPLEQFLLYYRDA